MNLNIFLIQLVLFSSVFMLAQAARVPRGWLAVTGVILAVLAVSFAIAPAWAGFISGTVWFLLFLVPLLGFAKVNRLVSQERYRAARKWATVLRWLHPTDGMVEYAHRLKGMELAQQGRIEDATALFRRDQSNTTPSGRMATVLVYRTTAQWAELVQWVEQQVPEKTLYQEMGLALSYLRAQGELGNLNQLLQGVATLEQSKNRQSNPLLLNTARLYALAFCGQVDSVKVLLNGVLSVYAPQTRQFWIATAELMTGRTAIAQAILNDLRHTRDQTLQQAIDQRLSMPLFDPLLVLTDSSRLQLTQLKTIVTQDSRYGGWGALGNKKSYVTYGLIVLNLLVFGATVAFGGMDDLDVLYSLGALAPEDVVMGEWWRAISALFLHAGVLHLATNMLGLFVFGSLVEDALGFKKFFLCYIFSGIGSMLTVTAVATLTQTVGQLTVGASGAVLGLVGAEAAIQLKGWRLEKAKVARDRLRLIMMIILLQIVSDLLTPQVSIVGHASGVVLGFLLGLFLYRFGQNA